MNTDAIEMTHYPHYQNNISDIVKIEEFNQKNNSYFYDRAIAIVNNYSFKGFVVGGAIGALIGVPIAFTKGFNTGYSDISKSSAIAITLITYFTGCIFGAYYKPIFSSCKQIITKSYTTFVEKI